MNACPHCGLSNPIHLWTCEHCGLQIVPHTILGALPESKTPPRVRFSDRLRRRIARWLAPEIAAIQGDHGLSHALFDPTAQLLPDGSVENHRPSEPWRVRVGPHCRCRGRLMIYGHGGKIEMGEYSYVGTRSEIWSAESIIIGKRVLISDDVRVTDCTAHSADASERHIHFRAIIDGGHPRDPLPGVYSSPIVIEDDVIIYPGVLVLGGRRSITIGARSRIAGGSVVLQDVPPDSDYRCQVTPILTPRKTDR